MSEPIKHECGIALIRLRKPFKYYINKYGTAFYALNKLYILLEKQHNRGQDGAGVAVVKQDVKVGTPYIHRCRSIEQQPIPDIFNRINKKVKKALKGNKDKRHDAAWMKENAPFAGELLLGHLRYGTYLGNAIANCHPFIRESNWKSRTLAVAGNFNMTNVDSLFDKLVELGQHPREMADTVTVLEKIGHFLDEENQLIFDRFKDRHDNIQMSQIIEDKIDLQKVLRRSCKDFDGGYTMAGITGYGGAFVARDPNGIRPAYYYADDEVVVVASEKPAIKIAFNVNYDEIKEIKPGHALIINKDGEYGEYQFREPSEKKSCSFERIYFSRGTDPDIYTERKKLGSNLCEQVLKAIDYDIENTVFSYIPNTAETAFLGLMQSVDDYLVKHRIDFIQKGNFTKELLQKTLSFRPRIEKLVIKDAKLRTFITNDNDRSEMISHVYDTTYEVIRKRKDTLVILDDSIVRGSTLEKSILSMLERLEPKKVIIVSSAPQIRYPDCYGIDMSKIGEFVAFRAMLELIREQDKEYLLDEVYEKCKATAELEPEEIKNFVKELFEPFTYDEISDKISEIVKPKGMKAEVKVVYQTIEGLHNAIPFHTGDWYFTGDYPTPGGNKVVNKAFVNFMEGKLIRAY
ncbi:MAG: amidophosphoribosyltransferase [Bacteroidetes bacterium]|nr:MAG: amidophosphoribosyltransferase [Bacteroidota bacterium]